MKTENILTMFKNAGYYHIDSERGDILIFAYNVKMVKIVKPDQTLVIQTIFSNGHYNIIRVINLSKYK